MDDNDFDRMARILGATPSRRAALGLIASALGVLSGTSAEDLLAKKKKKKKKKKGCAKKPCPQGQHFDKGSCKCECTRTPCSGGMEFDTGSCRCKCPSGMRECRDGCVGKDQCCPGDPPCPEDPKGCCHAPGLDVCTIDGCCRELDGIKACNDFCVDTNSNANHCGGCNNRCAPGEACIGGACLPPVECPSGIICPGRTAPHCGRAGFECCGDLECNAYHECCNPGEDLCCLKGRCVEGRCCPEGRQICGGKCCPFGKKCCGGECCSDFGCVNGVCCETSSCGGINAPGRVCTAENETCCLNSDNSGFACPSTEFGGACAANGRCCPAGTYYDSSCDKCCENVTQLCEDCVATFPGRTG